MSKVYIRIPQKLLDEILKDLRRPHIHAYERVGFCYGKSQLTEQGWIVFLTSYQTVKDSNYIRTNEVGARINSKAITEAFQHAFTKEESLFHIHLHDFGSGIPGFSSDDLRSGRELILSMQDFVGTQIHGMIVLSTNSFNAMILGPGEKKLIPACQITAVGTSLNVVFPIVRSLKGGTNRYSRQSFLGKNSEETFKQLKIGVVGLSGGGSHIVQQTAHIGFRNYVLADPECIDDDSNLNRIVGATLQDAHVNTSKFEVFRRLILGLHPNAKIGGGESNWEEVREQLKMCDIIFGCLDTILGRRDLENFCRRYMIPYIDIGMGVETSTRPYAMFGQVQLSTPGFACMMCNGFINEETLKREANNYGQKTKRPQVVWPNGILASTAVGIFIDMITGWSGKRIDPEYVSYDGNDLTLKPHIMKEYRNNECPHFLIKDAGPLAGLI